MVLKDRPQKEMSDKNILKVIFIRSKIKLGNSIKYSTVAWEKRSGNWEIHIKRSSPAEVSATFKFSGVASWKFIAYMTDDSVVVSTSWKTGTSTMFSVHKISNFLEYIRGVWTLEHKTCDILAAERLQLMRFDNRLIIDSLNVVVWPRVRRGKTGISLT